MFSGIEQDSITGRDPQAVKDDRVGGEQLLEQLIDGRLARRIAQTVRIAAAKEMLQTAQATQSTVEAEDSAK